MQLSGVEKLEKALDEARVFLSMAEDEGLEDSEAAQIKVDLHFKSMDDFSPENVARQVRPLKELMDLRTKLSDLRGSLQGNDKLEELLLGAVGDKGRLDKLKKEMEKPEGGSNA